MSAGTSGVSPASRTPSTPPGPDFACRRTSTLSAPTLSMQSAWKPGQLTGIVISSSCASRHASRSRGSVVHSADASFDAVCASESAGACAALKPGIAVAFSMCFLRCGSSTISCSGGGSTCCVRYHCDAISSRPPTTEPNSTLGRVTSDAYLPARRGCFFGGLIISLSAVSVPFFLR